MTYTTKIMMLTVMILLASIAVGGAYASTVTVSGGQISQAGDETSIPITLDIADNGLIYYQMRISVADPTVAQVTKVDFPTWAGLHNVATPLPATVVVVTAGDIQQTVSAFQNQPGTTNVPIATVTLKGLKSGSTMVNIDFVGQGIGGVLVHPAIQGGTLQVAGATVPTTTVTTVVTTAQPTTVVTTPTPTTTPTAPTTTVTTVQPTTTITTSPTTQPTTVITTVETTAPVATETTVIPTPTTPVVTTVIPTTVPTTSPAPPTGQAYFSTTPTGAGIFIDGASTASGYTPTIITLPEGTHQAVMKLAGYNEVLVNFDVTHGMTTMTAPRTLIPGSVVLPVQTTIVPTNTVTQATTVPITFPTTSGGFVFPVWNFQIPHLPSWDAFIPVPSGWNPF